MKKDEVKKPVKDEVKKPTRKELEASMMTEDGTLSAFQVPK